MSEYHVLTEMVSARFPIPIGEKDKIIRKWLEEKADSMWMWHNSKDIREHLELNQEQSLESKLYDAVAEAHENGVTDYVPITAQIAKDHYEGGTG